jgi:hypothetical protein
VISVFASVWIFAACLVTFTGVWTFSAFFVVFAWATVTPKVRRTAMLVWKREK